MKTLENKVAIVTGGTSGLGAATAIHFAELGEKVYAVGLKANLLEIPKGLDIEAIELDVTDEDGVKEFIESIDSMDILFNGAGVNLPNQYDIKTFKKTMDINLNSHFYISTLVQPLLAKSDTASIINVSFLLANFDHPDGPAK